MILNDTRVSSFEANPGLQRFTVAHEVGHWLFHADEARSATLPMLDATRTLCHDGARTPAEIQADLFASYLLMPTDRLRPELPPSPWRGWPTVYRLAGKFAVSPTAMVVRLEKGDWASSRRYRRTHLGPQAWLGRRPAASTELRLPGRQSSRASCSFGSESTRSASSVHLYNPWRG